MRIRLVMVSAAMAAGLLIPRGASAFCGFYVSGAGASLYNNATEVVMMRQGTRTVLSIQNDYSGPPKNFAMVVPVPVVLHKENVKTLPKEVFARVDKLAAPRLVEYWEKDPCAPEPKYDLMRKGAVMPSGSAAADESAALGVKVEAKFAVGEYQIVILSAKDSTGLDTWLRQEKYQIPDGAEPYLRPYVESGSKFFVAKVDVSKVEFVDGHARLSPLRFHYDSKEFRLPIRLGMMNSPGTQDLIVHILAPGQRYEVANYKNVTIPTNLDVKEEARERFGEFYAALFDATLEKNPGAVVTEYAWDAMSCDPCPEPALDANELATLGADVLGGNAESAGSSFVLTRLHARYAKGAIDDDLVFKAAPPIVGGREFVQDDGKLEKGAKPASINNFQARYAIRHEWKKPIQCEHPIRGRWGGPWPGETGTSQPQPATQLAFAPRGKLQLASVVPAGVPEIGVAKAPEKPKPAAKPEKKAAEHPAKKEKGCSVGGSSGGMLPLLLALVALAATRRRRR